MKWFIENHSFVLAIITTLATIALAVITYFYLRETKEMRQLAAKSFDLDVSPKLFVANIIPIPNIDTDKKTLELTSTFVIKNFGKTEAKNVRVYYKIQYGKFEIEKSLVPASSIFPTQIVHMTTSALGANLADNVLEKILEALENKKQIKLPENITPQISLNLKIEYDSIRGEKIEFSCRYKYNWEANNWSILAEEEKEDKSSEKIQIIGNK